jgi:Cu+-exporting ATPase
VVGMSCARCAAAVERTLTKKVPGVSQAQVNFAAETVGVDFDPEQADAQTMAQAVKDAGFQLVLPEKTRHVELPVLGMTCTRCSAAVERTLNKKVPGVEAAQVNFATEIASIDFDPGQTSLEAMAQAVKDAGYELVLPTEGEADDAPDAETQARQTEYQANLRAFVVGVAFTLPLFVLSMARDFGLVGAWSHAAWVTWLFLALATPVQFYTGGGFYSGGWKSLKNGAANMDVLVALGSPRPISTLWRSSCSLRLSAHVYFETSRGDHNPDQAGQALEASGQGPGFGRHQEAHGPGAQGGASD